MESREWSTDERRLGGVLKVLIVEDDADTEASLAMVLRAYGHDVQVARDGDSALASARSVPPDVILLDIGLRDGMSGWEVAKAIQEQPAPKRPLLVAITGYGGDEDRRRSEEIGIHLHLIKPVEPDALQNLLNRFQSVLAEPALSSEPPRAR
jgi:CheY-like chemotaxis protein